MSHKIRSLWRIFFLGLTLLGLTIKLDVMIARAEVIYQDFTATLSHDGNVLLEWWTESEVGNQAFFVQRSNTLTGVFTRLADSYILSESESGEGGYYYFYEDATVIPDQTYFYRIEAISDQGSSSFHGPISINTSSGRTSTPTQTGTIVALPTNTTATPTRPDSTATVAAAFTQSFQALTGTASLTGTIGATTTGTGTQMSAITKTPTPSKTFEPLPTIELLFPKTATVKTLVQEVPVPRLSTSTEPTMQQAQGLALAGLPDKLVVSIGIVGFLWLCLGVFLVFVIKRMSD